MGFFIDMLKDILPGPSLGDHMNMIRSRVRVLRGEHKGKVGIVCGTTCGVLRHEVSIAVEPFLDPPYKFADGIPMNAVEVIGRWEQDHVPWLERCEVLEVISHGGVVAKLVRTQEETRLSFVSDGLRPHFDQWLLDGVPEVEQGYDISTHPRDGRFPFKVAGAVKKLGYETRLTRY